MKIIYLINDGETLVDDEDYEWLNQWKWSLTNSGYTYKSSYVIDPNGKRIHKRFYMHRLLMRPIDNKDIDHINGVKLDNRKENLRIVTRSQNQMNKKKSKSNTSGYKGVCWDKDNKKWIASIRINGFYKKIGRFVKIEDAIGAYNNYAKVYFGKYAKLNNFEGGDFNARQKR